MISNYFDDVKSQIEKFSHIVENYELREKSYSNERGYIEGELSFIDESRLDFAEVKDVGREGKIKYNYHYMDNANDLIFRCDNAKHHKIIKTFPNHKHLPKEIIACSEPEINDVLSEIEGRILKKGL
jgi:hypothetical protein